MTTISFGKPLVFFLVFLELFDNEASGSATTVFCLGYFKGRFLSYNNDKSVQFLFLSFSV